MAAFDPIWSPVFIVLLLLTLIHSIVGLTLFHTRRHKFPLSGHSRGLVSLNVIAVASSNIMHMTAGILAQQVSCGIIFLFTNLIFFSATSFFVRAWRVWFHYRLQSERVSASKLEGRWFQDHVHWFTDARLVATATLMAMTQWLVSFAVYIAAPAWDELANGACPSLAVPQNVGVITTAIYPLMVAYIAFRIRHIYDAFGIKEELKYGVAAAVFIIAIVSGRDSWYDNNVYRALWWVGAQALIFFPCTIKVYRSYSSPHHFVSMKNVDSNELSRTKEQLSPVDNGITPTHASKLSQHLSVVFTDPRLLEEFTEHLKREFSVENLLFCQAARDFHETCLNGRFKSTQERNERAVRIYMEFVHMDAPSQVNLNSQYPKAIHQALMQCIVDFTPSRSMSDLHSVEHNGAVPADIFEASRKQIYRLMERDTFVRFKSNKHSRALPRRTRSFLRSHTMMTTQNHHPPTVSLSLQNVQEVPSTQFPTPSAPPAAHHHHSHSHFSPRRSISREHSKSKSRSRRDIKRDMSSKSPIGTHTHTHAISIMPRNTSGSPLGTATVPASSTTRVVVAPALGQRARSNSVLSEVMISL